jgi:Rps23 Pro-64 3,4-dihydroxylase Tpa1-like proline 4-hydroxylase
LCQNSRVPPRDPPVELASDLDADRIAAVYARVGRVHIAPILGTACAERTLQCLREETPWQLHLNDGDKPINLKGDAFEQLPEADRARFFATIHASAAQRFQYVFNSYPISDAYARKERLELYLMRVFEFLNSAPFLDFARRITRAPQIRYADAQATLYRQGHFLTKHDDQNEGKGRIAAYVLNLTPKWVADWGGILQFIDRDGHIAEGYAPVFNALNVFRVPQLHSVSYVAPFAAAGRFSITGWLRETSDAA